MPAQPYEASATINFRAFVRNTSPASNAGAAGISLPIGLTAHGLPVGIEIDVLPGNDEKLLALALSLEQLFGKIPPPERFAVACP